MTRDLKEQANILSPGWAVQGGLWLINPNWEYSSHPAAWLHSFLVCNFSGCVLTLETHRYTAWALNKEDRDRPSRNKEQKKKEWWDYCVSQNRKERRKDSFDHGGVGEWVCRKGHQSRKIPLPEGIKDAKLRTPSHHTSSSTGGALHTPAQATAMVGAWSFSVYFNSSARTVIMCLSHREENSLRGWELSDSCCSCWGSADEHLYHITLSLQDKVVGKVPGSSHPYTCGFCFLLSKYLTCLWPSRISVEFWHTTWLTKDTFCALLILVRCTELSRDP